MMLRNYRLALVSSSLTAFAIAIAGCAATSAPKDPADMKLTSQPATKEIAPTASSAEITANTQAPCDLVCERARIDARSADGPDLHAKATANANAVLDAMHDDLLGCYKKRVAVNPNAHGFITVDVVIDERGQVSAVETTGGAILGEGTMSCIVQRIKRASFDPPHGGGTLRIHVPFSLRRVSPGDETL